MEILIYALTIVYGLVIGSFLNVLILRIPAGENFVVERSHCTSCGYQLAWYDMVPVFSYVFLGGKCRKCGEHISIQYPLIEALNAILYLLIFIVNGVSLTSSIYCFVTSALIVIAVIDFRTFEIPLGINVFIGILGLVRILSDRTNWAEYVIGFFAVSVFLYVLFLLTKGQGIGGGDIKLMAASGLLLGWQCNILAFLLGCIIGSVCHLMRMWLTKEGRVLALGPYLSVGIWLAVLWGQELINWYFSLLW